MTWKKLIVLGDSNTQFGWSREGCWVSQLANMMQRRCDVINRGFSGYNSVHIRAMLPGLLAEFDVANVCGVVLLIGTNDSSLDERQHVPLEQYGENVRAIIDYIIDDYKLDKSKFVLMIPSRICDAKWEEAKRKEGQSSYHFDHLVKDYATVCRQLGFEKKLALVDLYKLMEIYGPNYGDLLFDGLHFSSSGSDMVFTALSSFINERIDPHLKLMYPYWKDLKPGQTKLDP